VENSIQILKIKNLIAIIVIWRIQFLCEVIKSRYFERKTPEIRPLLKTLKNNGFSASLLTAKTDQFEIWVRR
jgi:hypothetical protein